MRYYDRSVRLTFTKIWILILLIVLCNDNVFLILLIFEIKKNNKSRFTRNRKDELKRELFLFIEICDLHNVKWYVFVICITRLSWPNANYNISFLLKYFCRGAWTTFFQMYLPVTIIMKTACTALLKIC